MSPTAVRMVAASLDSPNWTFGLNPKHSGPRVPGPGTYDVAGRLDGKSVGTHFSRIGAKPKCPRADVKRLVFGTGRLSREFPAVVWFYCSLGEYRRSTGIMVPHPVALLYLDFSSNSDDERVYTLLLL